MQSLEREVAYHLGQLKRQFDDGKLQEENTFNAEETYLVIDMNEGRTLEMKGDSEAKFADFFSGKDGMMMMVLLGGAPNEYIVEQHGWGTIHVQNEHASYPIRAVQDDIPGVFYRYGKKGWMERGVLVEWLQERTVLKTLDQNRKLVLYVDNSTGNALTDAVKDALNLSNTEIRYLPKNATDLWQPADYFVIEKLKGT